MAVYFAKVIYNIPVKYTVSFTLLRCAGWVFGIFLPCTAALQCFHEGHPAFLFLLPVPAAAFLLFISRHLHYHPRYIDRMSGEQFERYLKSRFRRMGYRHIRMTRRTRDFGADLIMKKGLRRIVVQAKRYDRNIGVHAVQQALAAKAYYRASRAVVATNRYFTPSARKLAEVNDVILMDRETLFGIPQTEK